MAAKHSSKSRLFVPRRACRYHAGPPLLDSVIHWDVKSERHLVRVGDAVGLDVIISDLFTAVGVEDGQLLLVIRCNLLCHGRP